MMTLFSIIQMYTYRYPYKVTPSGRSPPPWLLRLSEGIVHHGLHSVIMHVLFERCLPRPRTLVRPARQPPNAWLEKTTHSLSPVLRFPRRCCM